MKGMITRLVLVSVLALVTGACGGKGKTKELEDTMKSYGMMVRWNEFGEALKFRHPDYAREHPVSDSYREFLGHINVTGYTVKQMGIDPDGRTAFQVVEVRYYNDMYGRERIITDRQIWRYEEDAERWWLEGGLPDFAAK